MRIAKRNHVLALIAICAVTYFLGLATHGLTNWQEGQRALVAREMQQRGEWIVPTINGEPYLAKPPMIYWCQLVSARTRSLLGGAEEVTVFDLRLTVALAGLAGVIATYFVGRRLLTAGARASSEQIRHASRAAFWAAAMLATGFLYVRSSRIGEIDILIVPFVVLAIGAVFTAWRSHMDRGRTHYVAVAAAALLACAAVLAKGPPALVCIACGAYGGIAAWSIFAREAGPGAYTRAMACLRAYGRTHPIAVLGLPLLAMWAWLRSVESRVGADAVAAAIDQQASENLRLFVLESPLKNLEAMSYGVGLGSIAALIAIVWLVRDRPKLWAGAWMILAWVAVSFAAFSVMGKGVPRYLTPMWPGLALLGGMWIASLEVRASAGPRVTRAMTVAVALLAIGQGLWYGYARETWFGDRSPRAFVAELTSPVHLVNTSRLAALDLWDPRLDYYTGAHVQPYEDAGPRVGVAGVTSAPVAQLLEQLRRKGGSYTLLIRAAPHPTVGTDDGNPIDRLRSIGFVVEQIEIESAFTVDNRKTPIIAVRVRAPHDD
ncbi:MAG: phospholipid carrier-dependent glycosyltransferase [Planctomycetes bacterium]|nr:phospholipid carrier-dependent glycosyltransferase [Planctomycetota bacterium]